MGEEIEPGIKGSRMSQILHTFCVNCNLQNNCPVYVASGTSETNGDLCVNSNLQNTCPVYVASGTPETNA